MLTGKDESLLVGRDAFFVLDLGLDVIDGVAGLHVESDRLSREGLDEDLHSTTESKNQVKGGLLLNVVIRKGSTVLKLLSSEDKSLLVRWDSLLVLNLGLHVVNRIRGLDIKSDGFAGESLDKDLHTSTKSEDEVESRFLLDIVVGEGSAIFELLSSKNKSLLIRGNAFLVLDLCFDIVNSIGWLDVEGDSLASKRLNENLHFLGVVLG